MNKKIDKMIQALQGIQEQRVFAAGVASIEPLADGFRLSFNVSENGHGQAQEINTLHGTLKDALAELGRLSALYHLDEGQNVLFMMDYGEVEPWPNG